MITLSKELTSVFFNTPADYAALKVAYREYAKVRRAEKALDRKAEYHNDRLDRISAAQNLVYLVLMGKDWRRAYRVPTNANKVANNAAVYWGLHKANGAIYTHNKAAIMAPFKEFVTPGAFEAVDYVLNVKPGSFNPDGTYAEGYEPYRDVTLEELAIKSGRVQTVASN